MGTGTNTIFLSYSSEDACEATLLQFAFEKLLRDLNIKVWTYDRDQQKDEREIANSIMQNVRNAKATLFLVSRITLNGNATQWMELAYSHAFNVPTFVLLHHVTYNELRGRERGVPPLLLASECSKAVDWKAMEPRLREILGNQL
ncbi:MAG: toll/interleukin-1 receptor domain-containing protein [Planctomycetaceae bacterium]|nr:toll/interleukin-1 receptor domain-containing protein [Planctomycetaceae bacterium]